MEGEPRMPHSALSSRVTLKESFLCLSAELENGSSNSTYRRNLLGGFPEEGAHSHSSVTLIMNQEGLSRRNSCISPRGHSVPLVSSDSGG